MKKINYFVVTILFLTITFSCSKNDERKQYEKELDKFSYKTYKTISGTTLNASILAYNLSSDEKIPVSPIYVRLLAGYCWAYMKKPSFTFAEGNLILEESKDPQEQALAHLLLAIGMYEKEWKIIAKEESDAGLAGLKKAGNKDAEIEVLIIHIIAGTVCIYDKNFEMAKVHFEGIAESTGIKWPVIIIDATADIENGDIQKGLTKIKEASKDESIPPEIRDAMKDMINDIEKKTGKIDGPLFWPKLIGIALFSEMQNSSNPTIKNIGKLPSILCK